MTARFTRFRRTLPLVVAGILSVGALPSKTAAQGAGRGAASGQVYDSLLKKPLARAIVRIQGTRLETIADAAGHFTFDSVPAGPQVFLFESPTLDQSGLRSAGVPATIVAGKPAIVNLGTPSLRRLWQVLCVGRRRVGRDSGIVTGTIVDGDRSLRLRKAPIALSWFNIRATAVDGEFSEVRQQIETDSLGAYYACGLPTEVAIKAKAFGDDATTGEVQYFVGEHGIRRIDMIVTTALAANSIARGTATLRGTVRDSLGRPVRDATVMVPGADTSTRTAPDGTYILRGLAAGTQGVQVRKVGFGMATPVVGLQNDKEAVVDVIMHGVTTLDTYAVRGEAPISVRHQDYLERRKTGLGINIDPSRRTGADALSFINNVTRVRIGRDTTQSGFVPIVMMKNIHGECKAGVFLDGAPSDAERMQTFPVDQLRAVEVFNSAMIVPPQFVRGTSESMKDPCGAIVYWSKRAW